MRTTLSLIFTLAAVVLAAPLSAAQYTGKSTVPKSESAAESAKRAAPQQAGLQQVVIVYKTHFDIGYTARACEVVHEYRNDMADRVLDAIEANAKQPKDKQFVWTLSGWPMKQILWEGQSPERRQKIEQAIRDGNLAIHAYPFTTHTETAEPEDLVRGLNISSTLARKYGLPLSVSAKMSDVPGQSWIFPTLFAHAGMKFYHMGGPLVNRSFNLPPMFWWEGPDGSRLLTLYNNGYGTSALPPGGWPYKSWLYISMTGDNQGPPDPGTVARDLAFYAARGIQAKVGTMDDFAAMILAEVGVSEKGTVPFSSPPATKIGTVPELPVVRSDIPDPWIHGMMSMPGACKQAQNVRPVIGALDALTTLERCWGIFRPDISRTIATAYEQSMLFSEHTWGLANQHYVKQPFGAAWDQLWAEGLPPQFEKMAESWRDHANYIDNIDRLVAMPYEDAKETLADHVNIGGGRIVVYNPLPWRRDGEVTLNAFHLPHGACLRPADGGPVIPYVGEGPALEDPYRIIRFTAKDVPPMGYRTYVVSGEKPEAAVLAADATSGVIESPFFKATLDAKRGRIASLIDKRSGRELVDAAAPQGFGQYFYERFGYKQLVEWTEKSLYPQYGAHKMMFSAYDMPKDGVYAWALPENMTLSVRKTAIDVTAVMTGTICGPSAGVPPSGGGQAGVPPSGGGAGVKPDGTRSVPNTLGQPQQVSIRLTLPAALPVADVTVSWQKQPDGWPETAWICLPFKCDNPRFRLGRVGADLDPVKDITVENANYHLFWINTGVAVYDDKTGSGVALCPQDTPLVSLGEPGEYKFDARYEPKKPYIYLNLYNNHWRTNFAGWIGDGRRMTARVRLWAFEKFNSESALYTPAMETRVPLAAARSTGRPGKLPPTQAGITLSRKGVAVTAFGPSPDGPGTLLRLWEQSGTSGEVTVTLPAGAKCTAAQPVTLRGENVGEPVMIKDGAIKFPMQAYAPASLLLNPRSNSGDVGRACGGK